MYSASRLPEWHWFGAEFRKTELHRERKAMSPRTRVLLLVVIMSGIAVGVTGITLSALYSAAFGEEKARLLAPNGDLSRVRLARISDRRRLP